MRRMNSALSGWQRVELEDWMLELDKIIRLVNNHLVFFVWISIEPGYMGPIFGCIADVIISARGLSCIQ